MTVENGGPKETGHGRARRPLPGISAGRALPASPFDIASIVELRRISGDPSESERVSAHVPAQFVVPCFMRTDYAKPIRTRFGTSNQPRIAAKRHRRAKCERSCRPEFVVSSARLSHASLFRDAASALRVEGSMVPYTQRTPRIALMSQSKGRPWSGKLSLLEAVLVPQRPLL